MNKYLYNIIVSSICLYHISLSLLIFFSAKHGAMLMGVMISNESVITPAMSWFLYITSAYLFYFGVLMCFVIKNFARYKHFLLIGLFLYLFRLINRFVYTNEFNLQFNSQHISFWIDLVFILIIIILIVIGRSDKPTRENNYRQLDYKSHGILKLSLIVFYLFIIMYHASQGIPFLFPLKFGLFIGQAYGWHFDALSVKDFDILRSYCTYMLSFSILGMIALYKTEKYNILVLTWSLLFLIKVILMLVFYDVITQSYNVSTARICIQISSLTFCVIIGLIIYFKRMCYLDHRS